MDMLERSPRCSCAFIICSKSYALPSSPPSSQVSSSFISSSALRMPQVVPQEHSFTSPPALTPTTHADPATGTWTEQQCRFRWQLANSRWFTRAGIGVTRHKHPSRRIDRIGPRRIVVVLSGIHKLRTRRLLISL